ncbi:MAG: GNAT family protein, partial [Candidatus Uhrbacteria bacterium]
MKIIRHEQILSRPNWAEELAELTRIVWTGADGRCYFPYQPLTTSEFWRTEISRLWQTGQLRSWVMVVNGKIVAHAALVKRSENHWELGRWLALNDALKGAVTLLCQQALSTTNGDQVSVECTQAHTRSQAICVKLGLRFAGIGALSVNSQNGGNWYIIYFDNLDQPDFQPVNGEIGNPLGVIIPGSSVSREQWRQIAATLTTDRVGDLPPTCFHV